MELFKISNRLKAVADMINKGNSVADIGTDHAYLPIYIVKEYISEQVIAMDVRKGPLEKAKNNVFEFNVQHNIELRLSDGLEQLKPLEAQTVTICGMGGPLIQSILEKGRDKINETTQLILSPQSEVKEFREYLYNNGYQVIREKMLDEDGQFYFIIECRRNGYISGYDELLTETDNVSGSVTNQDNVRLEAFLRYGKTLLEEKNASLYKYLIKEKKTTENVLGKVALIKIKDEAVNARIKQLEFDMECVNYALRYYA